MDRETYNTILQDYREGLPYGKMASKHHVGKLKIYQTLDQAFVNGDLKPGERRAQRECTKKNLSAQVKYATVCDLYKKGYTLEEIEKETGFCYETVKKCISRGQEEDNLFAKDSPERIKLMAERKKARNIERKNREIVYHYSPPTLKEGETVRCTRTVSYQCVYGARTKSEGQCCRYSLITGKCRTVNRTNGKLINPVKACACFSQKSRSNPKLNNATEESVK